MATAIDRVDASVEASHQPSSLHTGVSCLRSRWLRSRCRGDKQLDSTFETKKGLAKRLGHAGLIGDLGGVGE
jgi:hypothetical protein